MRTLAFHVGLLTWIDHHASAIKDYNDYMEANYGDMANEASFMVTVLEDGIAACEGAWKYLFPDKPMPRAVELLGQYDTWRNQDQTNWNKLIIPFQWGMRFDVSSAETFPQYLLNDDVSFDDLDKIRERGKILVVYQNQQNKLAMHGAFVIDFKGYRALACNGGGFNSQAFDSKWNEDEHDIMMPFKFDGKKWTFSLYTTKDIDCSALAKEMGGGGHKKAAGFQVEGIPEFIFPKYKETLDLLHDTTRNLGNPAYGQSTSTTMYIDELREKAFDFLGVPKE